MPIIKQEGPEEGKIAVIRQSLADFAVAMEATLRKHDEKKGQEGWKSAQLQYLQYLLLEEGLELTIEIERLALSDPTALDNLQKATEHNYIVQRVMEEAIDVANMAMMVYNRAEMHKIEIKYHGR